MLTITIPATEYFNSETNEFITAEGKSLSLEHSLVSISKWESKWHKPFFGLDEKTPEEVLDYIRCMTLTKNIDPDFYYRLTPDNIREIEAYIDNPMTATTFSDDRKGKGAKTVGGRKKIITSEVIYYWMVALNIPMECQKWHINRLLTLIRVVDIKNQPTKKMSKKDIINRNRQLNAARRQASGSSG